MIIEIAFKTIDGPPTLNIDGNIIFRIKPIIKNGNVSSPILSPLPISTFIFIFFLPFITPTLSAISLYDPVLGFAYFHDESLLGCGTSCARENNFTYHYPEHRRITSLFTLTLPSPFPRIPMGINPHWMPARLSIRRERGKVVPRGVAPVLELPAFQKEKTISTD
jgi:hypothetical protein